MDRFDTEIRRVASHLAPMLKRLGWTVDDAEQEGWVALREMKWPAGVELTGPYVYTALRRELMRRARRQYTGCAGDPSMLERVEARQAYYPATLEFVDLVDGAPQEVKRYLYLRVIDGLTWPELMAETGWTHGTVCTVRALASEWLLRQYEDDK